jgi:hypothetical protein
MSWLPPWVNLNWWDEQALRLQQSVSDSESERHDEYTEEEARQAAVRTRLDMVMVVSYLASANRFLASIRFTLIVLTLVVIVAFALKMARYW